MTYDDKCFYCPYKVKYVEPEIEKAKVFYQENGVAWRFSCQANYYPPAQNFGLAEIHPLSGCLFDKEYNFSYLDS